MDGDGQQVRAGLDVEELRDSGSDLVHDGRGRLLDQAAARRALGAHDLGDRAGEAGVLPERDDGLLNHLLVALDGPRWDG